MRSHASRWSLLPLAMGFMLAFGFGIPSDSGSSGDERADDDVLVARSTDGGATWAGHAELNTNAGSDEGQDVFPQVTTDGQGTWVAVWRSRDSLGDTIGTDDDILVARSTETGWVICWWAPLEMTTVVRIAARCGFSS